MPDHLHAHDKPIVGADGELIELFIGLIDRSPAEEPSWWYDFGISTGFRVNALLPPEAGRRALIELLRTSLRRIVDAGLSEEFLIRSLMTDLDEYSERIGDTGSYDSRIDDMRDHLQRVISDPAVRAQWRRIREQQDPTWIGRSDEAFIADAQEAYERFGYKYATVDDASSRWTLREAWRVASTAALPSSVYEQWSRRRNTRELREGH